MVRRPLIRPWTDQEDELLLTLQQQNRSLNQISARLRRSPGSVRYRMRLLHEMRQSAVNEAQRP